MNTPTDMSNNVNIWFRLAAGNGKKKEKKKRYIWFYPLCVTVWFETVGKKKKKPKTNQKQTIKQKPKLKTKPKTKNESKWKLKIK